MKYPFAELSAILVAAERDALYCDELSARLKRCIFCFSSDPANVARHFPVINKAAAMLYYGLTWLVGGKTLGDEYAHIQAVDVYSRSVPSVFLRVAHVLLLVWGIPGVPQRLRSLVLPLHLLAFYWNGKYLEPAKRLLGIRHISPEGGIIKRRRGGYLYQCLVLSTLINALVDLYKLTREVIQDHLKKPGSDGNADDAGDESFRCPLCLGPISSVTVTPCGHLYCWGCITGWLQRISQCPICRQECNCSSVYTIRI